MPEVFIKTGCDLSDIIIDWTEFKLQQPGNYDLSTLTFLNYKNTHTFEKSGSNISEKTCG